MTSSFWTKEVSPGYYDLALTNGLKKNKGLQAAWHHATFLIVSKKIKNNLTHLDYACGPGSFIGRYLSINSTGIDIACSQIEYAIKKYGHKANYYSTKNFYTNHKLKRFDVVTSLGLLEFLSQEESKNLIQNILSNSLKENGCLIMTTPNYNILMRSLEFIVNKISKVSYSGITKTKFTTKKLIKMLEETGYNYEINKIVNPGIFLGLFNIDWAITVNNFISNASKYNPGLILMITVKNKENEYKNED